MRFVDKLEHKERRIFGCRIRVEQKDSRLRIVYEEREEKRRDPLCELDAETNNGFEFRVHLTLV